MDSLTLFLQLALAMLTFAAPVVNDPTFSAQSDAWQYGTGGGIVGFIVLVLDVIVWSKSGPSLRGIEDGRHFANTGWQWRFCSPIDLLAIRCCGACWCLSVRLPLHLAITLPVTDHVAVPIVGILIYWLFSNREAHKPNAGYEPIG